MSKCWLITFYLILILKHTVCILRHIFLIFLYIIVISVDIMRKSVMYKCIILLYSDEYYITLRTRIFIGFYRSDR